MKPKKTAAVVLAAALLGERAPHPWPLMRRLLSPTCLPTVGMHPMWNTVSGTAL